MGTECLTPPRYSYDSKLLKVVDAPFLKVRTVEMSTRVKGRAQTAQRQILYSFHTNKKGVAMIFHGKPTGKA